MTGLEKLVEWGEPLDWGNRNWLDKARQLLVEEQSQSPDLPCYHGVCVNEKKAPVEVKEQIKEYQCAICGTPHTLPVCSKECREQAKEQGEAGLTKAVAKIFGEALMTYEMRSRPDGMNPPTREQDMWLHCYQTARTLEAAVMEVLTDTPAPVASGLYELCKELIQTIQNCKDWDSDGDPLENVDIEKAREILAKHTPAPSSQAEKVDGGLVEEVTALAHRNYTHGNLKWVLDELKEILSRHEATKVKPVEEGLRDEITRLRNLLEDVVNELDLSESAIEKHGPLGTAPSQLVKEVLAEKDLKIRVLKQEMVGINPTPAPVAGGLLETIKAEADKYARMPTISLEADEYDRIKGISQGLYMAVELVRRHPTPPSQAEKVDGGWTVGKFGIKRKQCCPTCEGVGRYPVLGLENLVTCEKCNGTGEAKPVSNEAAKVEGQKKTAADRATPVGVVVLEAVKHGKIGREILIMPTHDITLEPGTKVYLHPEGNETVCDMCEVLAKFGEAKVEPLPTAINGQGVISCPHCFKPVLNDVEPIAVLAKRNGFWKTITLDGVDSMANGFVSIEIEREIFDISKTPKRSEMFVAKTHSECEKLARKFLESLPSPVKGNQQDKGI